MLLTKRLDGQPALRLLPQDTLPKLFFLCRTCSCLSHASMAKLEDLVSSNSGRLGMRQAKARSVEKKRFWQGVLKEQSKSGLTVKAFCQQQGISVPSFYAWRRKLMKRKSDAGGQEDGPPRMVPVTVLPLGLLAGRLHGPVPRLRCPGRLILEDAKRHTNWTCRLHSHQ